MHSVLLSLATVSLFFIACISNLCGHLTFMLFRQKSPSYEYSLYFSVSHFWLNMDSNILKKTFKILKGESDMNINYKVFFEDTVLLVVSVSHARCFSAPLFSHHHTWLSLICPLHTSDTEAPTHPNMEHPSPASNIW